MSDEAVGRYRRMYPRIWRVPAFRAMNPTARLVALYLISGPQSNRIGLFHFSSSTAAEDLGLGVETLSKAIVNVSMTFGWHWDRDARVFYIPSWWRWNRPDNPKVLQGNLKDLSEIPSCGLVDAFARNLAYIDPKLHETFVECLHMRMRRGPTTQEQDQYLEREEEQEQNERRPKSDRASMVASSDYSGRPPRRRAIELAREVLRLTSANEGLQHLLDAFCHIGGREIPRDEAVAALNQALAERPH